MTEIWARPQPGPASYRRDTVGALLLAGLAVVTVSLYTRIGWYDEPAPLWLTALAVAGFTLPLAFRRRYPATVAVIVSAAFFVTGQFAVPEMLVSQIALFMAIYSLGAWGRNRRTATVVRILIIIVMFLWVTVNLVITVSDPGLLPGISRSGVFSQFASFAVINFLTNLLYFGGAYYFGERMWASARSRAELEARTAELAAERENSARQAVALDRVRIARELHDVVAHHVSVMGVQAGAARRVLASDPAQASASLELIEQSARSAVEELHRMLTTLRDNETDEADAAAAASSTLGLELLPELVEQSRSAGLPVTFTVVGEQHPVTGLAGYSLYRVAQEALTNVRKHAGSRASADLRLRYLADGVELEVTDDGAGRGIAGTAPGHGQTGMKERIAAAGGTLELGPRPRGGYLVRARVPFLAAAAQ